MFAEEAPVDPVALLVAVGIAGALTQQFSSGTALAASLGFTAWCAIRLVNERDLSWLQLAQQERQLRRRSLLLAAAVCTTFGMIAGYAVLSFSGWSLTRSGPVADLRPAFLAMFACLISYALAIVKCMISDWSETDAWPAMGAIVGISAGFTIGKLLAVSPA